MNSNDSLLLRFALVSVGLFFAVGLAFGEPPYHGTIFLDPDVITDADPTTFTKIEDAGTGERTMYDRRSGWVYLNAFLFNAGFSDAPEVEIQVNPEFGHVDSARREAERYAPVIGRLPRCIREDVKTVWIHKGVNPFGGGNENLLIHTGQADLYTAEGILEETLVHEGAHTSLDEDHANASGWLAAQAADGEFISTYARDNPYREDVAETFLLYFALRCRRDRISDALAEAVMRTVPNRIAYFDNQDLGLSIDKGDDSNASRHSWSLAKYLGSGWRRMEWFGSYMETAYSWIFHDRLGWLYRVGSTTESTWLWRSGQGWVWTSERSFPFLYSASSSNWLYLRPDSGKPLAFYDFALERWVTEDE